MYVEACLKKQEEKVSKKAVETYKKSQEFKQVVKAAVDKEATRRVQGHNMAFVQKANKLVFKKFISMVGASEPETQALVKDHTEMLQKLKQTKVSIGSFC